MNGNQWNSISEGKQAQWRYNLIHHGKEKLSDGLLLAIVIEFLHKVIFYCQ